VVTSYSGLVTLTLSNIYTWLESQNPRHRLDSTQSDHQDTDSDNCLRGKSGVPSHPRDKHPSKPQRPGKPTSVRLAPFIADRSPHPSCVWQHEPHCDVRQVSLAIRAAICKHIIKYAVCKNSQEHVAVPCLLMNNPDWLNLTIRLRLLTAMGTTRLRGHD
jgi:hypothetical protein